MKDLIFIVVVGGLTAVSCYAVLKFLINVGESLERRYKR